MSKPAALFSVFLFFGGSAAAAEYTIGVEALDYYPHYRSDAKGEFSGFARAVLDTYGQDRGHSFRYRPLPVTRLYAELIAGKVDFKYPDNAFWGKDAKKGAALSYSQPVVNYVDGLMVQSDRDPGTPIQTIGTVMGFTAFAYLDALAAGTYKVEERTSMDQLLKGVAVGRIDSAYVNIDVARHALKGTPEEGKLSFADSMPADRGSYHLSTLNHAELIKDFDAWLGSNADRVAALKKEYGLQN
ncbi:substrate-binding periplasmic protein [Pseudomarimonas arenosa]|uniref:Transporter substrate-binding domain-containing protein n=1 Tax=Pseudomarimonas arenosa TaxID=2774145 RepID=A0AAW3ZMU0_9GAMM|nr:transporter substrate-binding domain-containing protein [Pseudomarimonas arenosa]MBD8526849.1 transporter substrate-binding domain-containing protein [Pseudomarimonas arenosa]